jgi:hypothetical protein
MTRYRLDQYKQLIPPIRSCNILSYKTVSEYADCPVLIAAYEAAVAPFPYNTSTAGASVQNAYQGNLLAMDQFTPMHGGFVDSCRAALTTGEMVTTSDVKCGDLFTIYLETHDMLHQALTWLHEG